MMTDIKTVWSGYGEATLPLKRCPNCGAETRTQLARCPECNRRYDRRLPWLTDPMRWTLGVVALIGAGIGAYLILPGVFDARDDRLARLAADSRRLVASERARLIREQRPVRGRGTPEPPRGSDSERLAARSALVGTLEQAILTDTRARLASGELKGNVEDVECGPLIRTPDRPPDHEHLKLRIGRYDCVAVQQDVVKSGKRVGLFGHPYVAAIKFRSGTFTFCKDNKVPGERGKALVTVILEPACLGLPPDAKRLGNGYVIDDL